MVSLGYDCKSKGPDSIRLCYYLYGTYWTGRPRMPQLTRDPLPPCVFSSTRQASNNNTRSSVKFSCLSCS